MAPRSSRPVSRSKLLASGGCSDCRHDFAKPELGRAAVQGRRTRARSLPTSTATSGRKTGSNGRHPLPDPQDFEKWSSAGPTPKDQAVCYDAGPARWRRACGGCCWIGHDKVAVLDGGRSGPRRAGRDADVPRFTRFNYPIKVRADSAVDVATVENNLGKSLLLDARAPVRFRGEQEPIDPVAGRIKGAKNRFNMDNLSPEGVFKDSQSLRRDFEAVLGKRSPDEVIHYCGSGAPLP